MTSRALARVGKADLQAMERTALEHHALELDAEIRALRRREVSYLGDGELFVIRNQNGTVRAVKVPVTLDLQKGHLYNIGGQTGSWNVSADGFDALNQAAGLKVKSPDYLVYDGRKVGNPYRVLVDGIVEEVIARTVVIGRTPTGQIVAIDQQVGVRPADYLAQEITALATKFPEAARPCSERAYERWVKTGSVDFEVSYWTGSGDSRHQATRKVRVDMGTWEWFPVAMLGPVRMGVAFDPAHSEVCKRVMSHTDRVVFLERRAKTISQRNALRRHPSIATYKVQPYHVEWESTRYGAKPKAALARATVYSWLADSDDEESRRLDQMAEDVAAGMDVRGVQVESVVERTDEEDTPEVVEAADEEVEDLTDRSGAKEGLSVRVRTPLSPEPEVVPEPLAPRPKPEKPGTKDVPKPAAQEPTGKRWENHSEVEEDDVPEVEVPVAEEDDADFAMWKEGALLFLADAANVLGQAAVDQCMADLGMEGDPADLTREGLEALVEALENYSEAPV